MTTGSVRRNAPACVLLIFTIVVVTPGLAATALAKEHPARKPSQLWNQYPLNVQPSAKASESPSPRASQRLASTTTSNKARSLRPPESSNDNAMFFAISVVALLALGIAFSLVRRRQPRLKVAGPAWSLSSLRPGSSRASGPALTNRSFSREPSQVESWTSSNDPRPTAGRELAEPEDGTEDNDTALPDLEQPEEQPDLEQPEAGTEDNDTALPGVEQPEEQPDLEQPEAQPDLEQPEAGTEDNDTALPGVEQPEEQPGLEQPEEQPGLEQPEEEQQPQSIPAPAPAATAVDRERVRLQLSDGRSLEGWRRDRGSEDSQLLILDVIAAFDSEGNQVPASRADSFVLRAEVTSQQRIDDS